MKVFLTGTNGYLGSLLGPALMERGHHVVGLDTGYFNAVPFYDPPASVPTLRKDLRRVTRDDIDGCDAVVHLAELSNDPAGALAPTITYEINHAGSARLAELAKSCGVRRFVYTSSCSVYGAAGASMVDETSPTNPQTAYAVCKTLVERDLHALASDDFSPTVLRNATAFGASPYIRFDLVVNNLAGLAWTTRRIAMTSDGTPWRPLVHGLDIAKAVTCVLDAPRDIVHDEVFNVGDTRHNYRVREIAEIVAAAFPGCETSFGAPDADTRSYRVSFDKIHERLPGFSCDWDVQRGAEQLRGIFERVGLTPAMFTTPCFTRLAQLRQLRETKQLDDHFYWVA